MRVLRGRLHTGEGPQRERVGRGDDKTQSFPVERVDGYPSFFENLPVH